MSLEALPPFDHHIIPFGPAFPADQNRRPTLPSHRLLLALLMEDVLHERIPGTFRTRRPHNDPSRLSLEIVTKTEDERKKASELKDAYMGALAKARRAGFIDYDTISTTKFRKRFLKPPLRQRISSSLVFDRRRLRSSRLWQSTVNRFGKQT